MNLSLTVKEMFGQNEMDIYQNEENDIFMTREQIGQALEYTTPRKAISDLHKRHSKRLNRFSAVSRLRTTDGKTYETIVYNEKGIYEIARKSGQSKADAFYDWVYELLSKLRKNEVQIAEPNNRKLLLETALEHEKKIETIQSDVTYLKESMRINGNQEHAIKRKANGIVIESLGGKSSPAYKKMAFKVFSAFWRDFKNHFEIPRYGELPKMKFEEGLRFIGMWQPSTSLKIEIDNANCQQTIQEVI